MVGEMWEDSLLALQFITYLKFANDSPIKVTPRRKQAQLDRKLYEMRIMLINLQKITWIGEIAEVAPWAWP